MSRSGTDIYYISGPGSSRIGLGQFYPDDLTADSVPNPDEWGPDNYWSPQTYIDWFTANVQAYGVQVAVNKMYQAIDEWGLGGAEFSYCYDSHFVDFFAYYGIDVETGFCNLVNDGGEVVENVTDTVSTVSTIGKWAIPAAIVVGLWWIASSDTPREYVKRKLR